MHPLLLTPTHRAKVWGGERLGHGIGERIALAQLPGTDSVVSVGPQAGATLHELRRRWGADLTGSLDLHPDEPFPWLIKWLDARHDLSVQVHPPADEPGGKDEAWVIVQATPGASLWHGLAPGAGRTELADALRDGRVTEVLQRRDALPGSCHVVPGGTVHALGAGVLALEVQTPAETTWRLWDWGRPRELHIAQGLDAVRPGTPPAPTSAPGLPGVWPLCRHPAYALDWLQGRGGLTMAVGTPTALVSLAGSARLRWPGGFVRLSPGQTWLWPAALTGGVLQLEPDAVVVRVRVPGDAVLAAAA